MTGRILNRVCTLISFYPTLPELVIFKLNKLVVLILHFTFVTRIDSIKRTIRLLSFHEQIQIIFVQNVPEDYDSPVLDFSRFADC